MERNSDIKLYLDTSYSTTPQWSDMGTCFHTISYSLGEIVNKEFLLENNGEATNEIIASDAEIVFEGDYLRGNLIVEFLLNLNVVFGKMAQRKVSLKIKTQEFNIIWTMTVKEIRLLGGKANDTKKLRLVLCSAGKPVAGT